MVMYIPLWQVLFVPFFMYEPYSGRASVFHLHYCRSEDCMGNVQGHNDESRQVCIPLMQDDAPALLRILVAALKNLARMLARNGTSVAEEKPGGKAGLAAYKIAWLCVLIGDHSHYPLREGMRQDVEKWRSLSGRILQPGRFQISEVSRTFLRMHSSQDCILADTDVLIWQRFMKYRGQPQAIISQRHWHCSM